MCEPDNEASVAPAATSSLTLPLVDAAVDLDQHIAGQEMPQASECDRPSPQ